MSYVNIPAQALKTTLAGLGMTEKATPASRYSPGEVYFERAIATMPSLVVKVYTSIPVGGAAVRGNGQDAIRVCLVWRADESEEQSVGLVKATKILRVTSVASVLSRVRQRVRDLNREAMRFYLNVPKCPVCGCPLWEDSKRCRNRGCRAPSTTGRAAVLPARPVGASKRLASAFGSSHGSVPMTQAQAAAAARPVMPVDEDAARRRLAAEAARNVVEEPVLTKADMPPELQGLF